MEQYWRENAVIDQLLDRSRYVAVPRPPSAAPTPVLLPACRLPIKECDFVLVNVGTAGPLSVGSETAEQVGPVSGPPTPGGLRCI